MTLDTIEHDDLEKAVMGELIDELKADKKRLIDSLDREQERNRTLTERVNALNVKSIPLGQRMRYASFT